MSGKTAQKILENWKPPQEGVENDISEKNSGRKPIEAGRIGDIKGQNHMRDSAPRGAKPVPGVAACRNFSQTVGAAGKSQLTREVGQPGR